MASPFEEAMAAADVAVAETLGEAIRITPRTDSGGYTSAAVADPDRPEKDVKGVFSTSTGMNELQAPDSGPRNAQRLAGGGLEVWLEPAAVAALGYKVKKGDHVTRLDKEGQPKFSVTLPIPEDDGALALKLITED